MKVVGYSILLLASSAAFAQQWEFGAVGGGQFLSNVSVTAPSGSAKAGFAPGAVVGAFLGQSLYKHLSGEIRYEYMQSNLQLTSGGQTASFSGAAHAVHYDLVWHTAKEESKVQFYAAAGGGMKIFQGTGAEQAYQSLSQFGYFTKTHAVKPMVSVGGGISFMIGRRMYLRTELRDFITMFPKEIITPPQGVKYGSLLHDFVPMVGIDYVF